MKITMVGNFGLWNKGTMGSRALPMAKALVSVGHEVSLVIPPWDDPQESGVEDQMEGVRVIHVKLPPRIPLLWHALLTMSLLFRTLRERSDVVHIFKPKAYAGLVQMAAVSLRRLRLVNMRIVLDTDDWEGEGGWNDLESFPRLIKWLIAWHEGWCLKHADAITVASRELEKLVLAVGIPGRLVFYAPNGVWNLRSRGQWQPPEDDLRSDDSIGSGGWRAVALDECAELVRPFPTVLLYSRFFEFDVERVVKVFSTVRVKVPLAKLLVVGKGLLGEEEKLARLVRDASLHADVYYAGWVRAADLPKWFELADVGIYPLDDTLLNRAKCPMKLVDLMSFGIPVVADRVGQAAEYVEDGASGLLVSPGDIAAFADAVARLLLDAGARREFGGRARERVLGAFDWKHLIANVEMAYGIPGASCDETRQPSGGDERSPLPLEEG